MILTLLLVINMVLMKSLAALVVIASFLLAANSFAQTYGCTDSLAINFNPAATINDGSCFYDPASIEPQSSTELPSQIPETSGLTFWNNLLWTHNDNTDTKLYGLDTTDGSIVQSYLLNNITNTDWEEITEDNDYLYIGDFGNNSNGNRTDLKILRISKVSLLSNNPSIDTIGFNYSDQVNFSPTGANNTDFDCESMIVSADSIYLFTKQWISKGTSVYSLPKTPGIYTANHILDYNVEGLVTGATYLEDQHLVMLCGYNMTLSPFVWLLYDFEDRLFFSGNKRKVSIKLPFHQVEAIYTSNGLKVYATNEEFSQFPLFNTPQQLHIFDFSPFLAGYLSNQTLKIDLTKGKKEIFIFPNPATSFVFLNVSDSLKNHEFRLFNSSGSIVESGRITGTTVIINVDRLRPGVYLLKIGNHDLNTLKLIRR